ncbi:tousled-like kinase [Fistulifera solaris]|uniref:Tousled-like kinase n=1 Tax=Fistulifera solaris TaxID=1519565 RepID=A0A1Z5JGV6_FISSO|nr:tousled-like kinase [Fistulifera solaris]|eukprot:GAX13233.1 tousled-like kinase [Fistulifera solaris]
MLRRRTTTTSEVERKLELLEARFTAPPATPPNSVDEVGEEESVATHKSTTPRIKNQHSRQGSSRLNNSQHSFGFDTPSLSGHSQSISARQKAARRSSLSIVEAATTKHLRKIAGEASSSDSASNAATILTGHQSKKKAPVPETPSSTPVISMQNIFSSNNSNHNSNSVTTTTDKKRKQYVPVKRDRPSIKENLGPIAPKRKVEESPRPKRTKPSNSRSLFYYFRKEDAVDAKVDEPVKPVKSNVVEIKEEETVEYWKIKCENLEKECLDKEEQLSAVSNNRTIIHTALQSALNQRELELKEFKELAQKQQSATASVLEEFLRQTAEQEAVTERERLAADGARLGRIVRTGVRWQETWQDGHATKQLNDAKEKLAKSLKELKQRQHESQDGKTPLEITEHIESTLYHIGRLRQEERELCEEEKRLNVEKTRHIRALKRVASEDSSRFRSRPKLNDRYVLQSLLGKGGFSEVWRAYDLEELREVAVKIHQLDPRWSDSKKENYTKHVSREYEIHRNVRHPRIVSLYDVFEIDSNSFATVLECCSGTDLDILLKDKRRIPERDARAILLQILSGMNYLSHPSAERQGIIHYDLKPGNILFDENGDAKITDFGLSKIVDTHDPADSMELTSQGAGTYWYLPPECFVMDENVRISNKVDVWSIGVIFFQMIFGKRPFGDGQSQDKILADQTMLNAHEVKFPDKIEISSEGKEFIRACLSYDQAYRPTIAQLCEHSYVVKDWDSMPK